RAAQWRDLLHAARSPDRHRKLETALQCRSSARLDRLPRSSPGGVRPSTRRMAGCATPTSSAGHAPAGATANAKLRFKSDHQAGAGHLLATATLPPATAPAGYPTYAPPSGMSALPRTSINPIE